MRHPARPAKPLTLTFWYRTITLAAIVALIASLAFLSCSPGGPLAPPNPGIESTSILGPQKILIIYTQQSGYASPSISQAHAESWYSLNSLGSATLSLTIVGPYTAPCNLSTQAMIDLADPDVDFSLGYYGIMFGRTGSGCSGSTGAIGDFGVPTDEGFILISGFAWVDGSHATNQSVWLHEMMHMYGLSDSFTYSCTPSAGFPISCSGTTYTDCNTVMGGVSPCNPDPLGDLVAFDKALLGWITPRVVFANEHTLTDYETTGDALRIPKNATQSYYAEMREGTVQLRIEHGLLTEDLTTFVDPYGPTLSATGPTVTISPGGDFTLPTSNFRMPDPLVGTIEINMAPFDSSGIYMVQFREGYNIWRIDDTSYPFSQSFDSTPYADGPHTFFITLIDNAGNTKRYEYNTTINNTNPPTVGIP